MACVLRYAVEYFFLQNFCLATREFRFHHFIKKELSDCPVNAIHMAVNFLYSYYVDINLKNFLVHSEMTFDGFFDF
jgi:hypothetical protein